MGDGGAYSRASARMQCQCSHPEWPGHFNVSRINTPDGGACYSGCGFVIVL